MSDRKLNPSSMIQSWLYENTSSTLNHRMIYYNGIKVQKMSLHSKQAHICTILTSLTITVLLLIWAN